VKPYPVDIHGDHASTVQNEKKKSNEDIPPAWIAPASIVAEE
jgi:hypothetical protein